jgi:hypothetical protein
MKLLYQGLNGYGKIFNHHPQTMKTTLTKFIGSLNFELLKAQKIVLIELQGKLESNGPEWSTVEGIINLIDSIQDIAVDQVGFNPNHVFNLSGEDEHIGLEEANKIR